MADVHAPFSAEEYDDCRISSIQSQMLSDRLSIALIEKTSCALNETALVFHTLPIQEF